MPCVGLRVVGSSLDIGKLISLLPKIGLRVGVSKGGCSGKSYNLSYAYDVKPLEEVVKDKGTEAGDFL